MSRRLNGLLYSPRLLQGVSLKTRWLKPERLTALSGWLAGRCAGHMRRLELKLCLQAGDRDSAECSAHLAGMLAACGTAGGLAELHLSVRNTEEPIPVHIGGWAAAARDMQRMRLDNDGALRLVAPLHTLSALQELRLDGWASIVATSATLPPALTSLAVGPNFDNNGMQVVSTLPQQV